MRRALAMAALLLGLPALASAQTFSLEVLPAGSDLQPGQPFGLTVRGQWPAKYKAQAMNYAAALSQFTLKSQDVTSSLENESVVYQANLVLAVADAGLYVVPALVMALATTDGTLAQAQSRRLFLEIPKGAVAAAELRPNKPLQGLSWQLGWLWWTLGALVLLGAAAYGYWRWLGRPRAVVVDPYADFNGALAALRNDYDAAAPLGKAAAFQLSHIARQYVERRAGIAALEMTGKELSREVATAVLPGPERQPWQDLATQCQELEGVKYRPGGVSDQTVATWCARASRAVENVETMLNISAPKADAA